MNTECKIILPKGTTGHHQIVSQMTAWTYGNANLLPKSGRRSMPMTTSIPACTHFQTWGFKTMARWRPSGKKLSAKALRCMCAKNLIGNTVSEPARHMTLCKQSRTYIDWKHTKNCRYGCLFQSKNILCAVWRIDMFLHISKVFWNHGDVRPFIKGFLHVLSERGQTNSDIKHKHNHHALLNVLVRYICQFYR